MNAEEFNARYSTCPPGSAPGGVLVRVVQEDGTLVVERALRSMTDAEDGLSDHVQAGVALERTRRPVRLYAYDGDTGACMQTVILDPADLP